MKTIKIQKDDENIPMNITIDEYEYSFRLHDWVATRMLDKNPGPSE